MLANKIPRKVIAKQLYLSIQGLQSRIYILYRYLGVDDLKHALLRAKRLGWLNDNSENSNHSTS